MLGLGLVNEVEFDHAEAVLDGLELGSEVVVEGDLFRWSRVVHRAESGYVSGSISTMSLNRTTEP
jgi:hypothetical protein